MKKLLLLIALCTLTVQAQERFTFGLWTEAADKNTHNDVFDYGFNIGAKIGLQLDNKIVYIAANAFAFPELNNIGYYDFDGRFGLNFRDRFDNHRVFMGGIVGLIKRKQYTYPKLGVEIGYEYYIDNIYFGASADYQHKTDNKYWGEDGGHNVKSFSIHFGWHWL